MKSTTFWRLYVALIGAALFAAFIAVTPKTGHADEPGYVERVANSDVLTHKGQTIILNTFVARTFAFPDGDVGFGMQAFVKERPGVTRGRFNVLKSDCDAKRGRLFWTPGDGIDVVAQAEFDFEDGLPPTDVDWAANVVCTFGPKAKHQPYEEPGRGA